MNKASVREPEVDGSRCPRCGSPGGTVGPETLRAQLPEAAVAAFAGGAYYFSYPGCAVSYFDRIGQTAPAASPREAAETGAFLLRLYIHETPAPGLSADWVE